MVVPDVEFTSNLFPYLVQSRLDVRTVPVAAVADAVADGAGAVAFSAVQMSTGEVADVDAILEAASAVDAVTICDATQAVGWLPIDAGRFDARRLRRLQVADVAARHRLSHRLGPAARAARCPTAPAGTRARTCHASYFGPPLRLAARARRFDLSPAWFCWVGTAPALELIEEVGVQAIHDHDVALANRFRAGLGMEAANSAIVSADVPDAAARLERAGIVAAMRGGRLRTSWHVYNDERDVDRVLEVILG